MSSGVPLNSARRTVTFASGEVVVANGIITSFATSASPVTKVATDMTGAAMSGTTGRFTKLPRSVTITLSASAGSYTTNPIVVTGTRNGKTVTENLTPTGTGGGETLRGARIYDSLVSIAFPAQGNGSGAFTVGVQDIGTQQSGDTFNWVELAAVGTLNMGFGEDKVTGAVDTTDALPIATAQVGMPKPVAPCRILTSAALSSPTNVGLTVYCP